MQTPRHIRGTLYPHGQFRPKVLLAMVRHRWFIRMRWLFVFGALGLLLLEYLWNPGAARHPAVLICIGSLGTINAVWTLVGRRLLREPANEDSVPPALLPRIVRFANVQMTSDILILTVILRYSGGIENPMVVFYLFHMLIAALLLRPLNALLQGLWALVMFAGLAIGECVGWIDPHYPFLSYNAESALHTQWVFVSIEVGVMATAVFGTLYFTLQISSRLDAQEQSLYETNRALKCSQEAIKELQARRARFMQTAAHQLKSPLAGVQTLAGLIHDGVVKPERLRSTCARIIRRCKEGIAQVTELLTLARVQQADPMRHHESFTDVGEVVREICRVFGPQAEEKNIELCCRIPEGVDLRAFVDQAALADCVGNLIDNAIKYTTGPGSVRVEVSRGCTADTIHKQSVMLHVSDETATPAPSWVLISVKDNGMGIEPEALGSENGASQDDGSIFDSFRRGGNALAAGIPGTGLGLAIVREVVEQAEGQITVESALNEGSTFTIAFQGSESGADRKRRRKARPMDSTSG